MSREIPLNLAAYRKVMDEIQELSAALNLGKIISKDLARMNKRGPSLMQFVRDVRPTGRAGKKRAFLSVYPSDGLIGVLLKLREKRSRKESACLHGHEGKKQSRRETLSKDVARVMGDRLRASLLASD